MLLIFSFLKSPNCFLASHFHFVDVLTMIKSRCCCGDLSVGFDHLLLNKFPMFRVTLSTSLTLLLFKEMCLEFAILELLMRHLFLCSWIFLFKQYNI